MRANGLGMKQWSIEPPLALTPTLSQREREQVPEKENQMIELLVLVLG